MTQLVFHGANVRRRTTRPSGQGNSLWWTVALMGGVGALAILGYGALELHAYIVAPAPIIPATENSLPGLDLDQVNALSEGHRRKVLRQYGEEVARAGIERFETGETDSMFRYRREVFATLESLNEDDRRVARDAMREQMQAHMRSEMDRFFALSKEEQQEELDRRIDQFMALREAREADKTKNPGDPARKEIHKRMRDPERREQHFRKMLTRTTPEDRAKMMNYFGQLMSRASERGVNMHPQHRTRVTGQ